jgi:ADP-ribosylglycohydrolase
MDLKSRYEGSLLGLAAGDALGTTVEFKAPGTFAPMSEIVGGGPFNLPRGAWTDDTSLALWAFSRSTNFRDGCLLAVNLGYDATENAGEQTLTPPSQRVR